MAVNQILTKDDCLKILKRHINDQSAKLKDYKISRLSDSILGFLGDHFKLKLMYTSSTNDKIRKIDLFLKTIPTQNAIQSRYVQEMRIFHKECLIYKKLLLEFNKIAKARVAPKYYYSKNGEVLVLEDLRKSGFRVISGGFVDGDRVDSLLRTLAKFHAASVVYEESRSVGGTSYRIGDFHKDEIVEATFAFDGKHPRCKWVVNVTNCLLDCIKAANVDDNKKRIACDNLKNYIAGKIQDYIKPSTVYRNVITHSDLWLNNIMFNDSGECVLVDFQLARYTPPVLDLLMILFLGITQENLDENLSSWLDDYYSYFVEELAANGINHFEVFPKDLFLSSVKDYTLPVLIESAMFGTNIFMSDELSDFIMTDPDRFAEYQFTNRSKYIVPEYQKNAEFAQRFSHVLLPLIKHLQF